MPAIDLSILNQRQTPAFYADTLANRPAAGFIGRIFVSTNTFAFFRDNGTGWDLIGGPGTGTVTGSGAANQIAFWSGASVITGENNLYWDSVQNHLGVNTTTPAHPVDISGDQSRILSLNQTNPTNDTEMVFKSGGTALWRLGNSYGGGTNRFVVNEASLNINRFSVLPSSGQTFVGDVVTSSGLFVVNSNSGDAHIVALGATAPSIRVRNAGVGASLQFGLGLATTTNNFIQGATGGEFCIFNDSLTAQPILFGIRDAGLGNTQEAARISPARNFLIGTTTDAGQKLQVSGTSLITGVASFSTTVRPTTNFGSDLGSSSFKWSDIWGYSLNLSGGTTVNNRITLARGTDDSSQNALYGWNSITVQRTTVPISGIQTDFSIIQQGSDASRTPFYISTAGNVGIGTTTVTSKLQISSSFAGVATVAAFLLNENTNINTETRLAFAANANNDITTNRYSYISALNTSGSNGQALTFATNATGSAAVEAMRISSSQNVLIGTTTDAGQKLQVNGNISISNGNTIFAYTQSGGFNAMVIQNTSNNTNARCIEFRGWNNSVTGSIETYVNVTTYNTSSDYRLKEDLKEFNGLSLINSIKTYDFKWKESENRMYGVIAHELQSVLPYAVSGEKDGKDNQGVDYSKIVPLLVKAIQELNTKIENLK